MAAEAAWTGGWGSSGWTQCQTGWVGGEQANGNLWAPITMQVSRRTTQTTVRQRNSRVNLKSSTLNYRYETAYQNDAWMRALRSGRARSNTTSTACSRGSTNALGHESSAMPKQLGKIVRDTAAVDGGRGSRGKTELVNLGVEAEQIHTVGFGKTNFVSSNDNAPDRARNRRVEITITAPAGIIADP